MSTILMPYSAGHMRLLLRHAIVRVLTEQEATAVLFAQRVHPNREEHWLEAELPAVGVYTLKDAEIETDQHPDPEEWRIDLIIEVLARAGVRVDDALDHYAGVIEATLTLDRIGDALGRIVNERLVAAGHEPMVKLASGRWPVDSLLLLELTGTELGIGVEGERQVGVAAMQYDLEYAMPRPCPEGLPDLLACIGGWDVQPADGCIDMVSRVTFDPAPAPEAEQGSATLADVLPQIDQTLEE